MPTLFQTGTLIGMLQGVYEGDVDFKTLFQHGDIGLGTLNGIDGEMLALDGNFYHIDEKGSASIVDPDAYTPFCILSKFKPTHTFTCENIESLAQLNDLLTEHLDTPNIFHIIRIDVEADIVKIRSEDCAMRPYKHSTEILHKLHNNFELNDISGTLVITYCPRFSGAFTITGFHYHFIDQERTRSGHVSAIKINKGKVMITPIRRFSMLLSRNKSFDEANLDIDIESAMQKFK
jgi:acetolactate decarboxylase